jgi:uncharacterized membrane protein (Fun14 family)
MESVGFDIGGGIPRILRGDGGGLYDDVMNTESIPESSIGSGAAAVVRRSLLGSKSLWTAIVVTLVGAASWGYSVWTKPSVPQQPTGASAMVAAETREVAKHERFIDSSAPRAVRYGLSFIGAFMIAFFVKKVIKSVLLVAGLVISAIAALKYFGLFEYDWSAAQQQVEQGVELARQESGRLAKLASDYLPSSVAGGLGAVFGAKRG